MWIVIQKFVGVHARPRWRIVENEHTWVDGTMLLAEQAAVARRTLARVRELADANPDLWFRMFDLFNWPISESLPEPDRLTPDLAYGPVQRPLVARHGPYPALP